MKTFYRVSLRGLMLAILVLGVGVAALRNASPETAGGMRLLTLGMLALAVPGVVYRREARRAWWLGFGLFGWGYVALMLAPWSSRVQDPMCVSFDALYARVSPARVVALESFAAATAADEGQVVELNPPASAGLVANASDAVVAIGTLDAAAFRHIGHCLLALVAGLVGALVAVWFYASRDLAPMS